MKSYNLIIILYLFSLSVFSQKLEFTYGKITTPNEEELNNLKDITIKNNIIDMNKSFELVEYQLLINENIASFMYIEKVNTPNFNKRAITMGGGDGTRYYDNKKSNVIHKTELLGDIYFVKKRIDHYNWEITKESKIISGFLCYKAKTSFPFDDFRGKGIIELIAWFCPEFPYPYGPDIFYGLPGLVFEANQKNSKIKFYLKKIQKFNSMPDIKIPTEKTISEEEMITIFNKAMEDLVNQN
jgi:GLPGLI family protein